MDLATLLVLLAILVPVVAYLVFPLWERQETRMSDDEHRLVSLEIEQERLFSALAELDMDYSMGKLVRQDYEAERATKLARGAAVLRQIDALRSVQSERIDQRKAREEELETRIARLRKPGTPSRKDCPTCGREITVEDRFCRHCGTPLESQEKMK
ncbi:MAG TPA: zinc ribbon domain-containing protein [Anaerolineae bacterium]|nr:zinc ribbon domain-containing protein [Anaerolineae bacterium]